MKLITLIAASTILATPALAQDIATEKTVEEVFALGQDAQPDPLAPMEEEVEKTVVVKKIDQDGNETEEEVEVEEIEKIKSNCPGRVFRTSVETKDDEGNVDKRAVTLCSDSDTDEAWLEFLNNAKRQIALSDTIPDDAKEQLLSDLDEEIRKAVTSIDG
ncbi:hypothetical protein [Sphingomicrobium flavum]|uniref:hypothetical protein n=1 Tax=Sphingomicrobium flavum TaxID=1229164 RepID=UPI0021AD9C1D|nr:hypothetical protein [Sphingomicrobium flavum]